MTEKSQSEILPESPLPLEAQIEAILFVSPYAVRATKLADLLEVTRKTVETALDNLKAQLAGRGIRLQHHQDGYVLTSAPETAIVVERFLDLEATTNLSKAAMETLAIIAYQQPVTRPQIDSVRGVNSDGVMRSLTNKGLIEEAGRSEGPGRPILFTTTPDFLGHFGLTSIQDLPELNLEATGPDLPPAQQVPLKE